MQVTILEESHTFSMLKYYIQNTLVHIGMNYATFEVPQLCTKELVL